LLQGSPRAIPGAIAACLRERCPERLEVVADADELLYRALRGRPVLILVDARGVESRSAGDALRRLKRDSYTAVLPAMALADDGSDAVVAAFEAGADEVLADATPAREARARIEALLRRSERDTSVQPTTRLPGTSEIEAEIERRITSGEAFAACYADLDHFKEFNDRYGYNEGDRVIRMLARILHDVVKGVCGERGFVGHIGGDDFMFVVPEAAVPETCGGVVETFDTLIPLQYSDADRRAGYYFGKDRRGQLHRVPLMTVSIGVVTTERRRFARAADVSELASEMKSYAKSLPGSLFAVDRRQEELPVSPAAGGGRAATNEPQTAQPDT
jgi:diguanylate cyclase (GGDEF)-like protein